MAENCPTCGLAVRVVSDREGTSHYEAAEDWRREWEEAIGWATDHGFPYVSVTVRAILAADAALRESERKEEILDAWKRQIEQVTLPDYQRTLDQLRRQLKAAERG